MLSTVSSYFKRVWYSNAVEDMSDMTDVLKKNICVAQHNVEILEKIYSENRQGHVEIELAKGEHIQSTPPIRHFEEAVNKVKDSLKKCLDAVEYYDRKRQEQSSRHARYPSANTQHAIQLYCAQKTDLTDYAMQELETKLRSQHGRKLQMQIRKNVSSIQSCIPLIVICLSTSRLGVDLTAAISGLPTGPNTAVLIFHHKKEHALPTEPSDAVLKEDAFKNVGIIIDVAFFEDMGLYDCDMNTRAYKSLISFIEGHCKK